MSLQTIEQAANDLQVTPETVRRWARAGKIPARKVGRLWRIEKTDGAVLPENTKNRKPQNSLSTSELILSSLGVHRHK